MVAGDLNGHVGRPEGGVQLGFGNGGRNPGDRVLEFDDTTDGVANTFFNKKKLQTTDKTIKQLKQPRIFNRKMVKDVKDVAGEECTSQYKLVVCYMINKSVNLEGLLSPGIKFGS